MRKNKFLVVVLFSVFLFNCTNSNESVDSDFNLINDKIGIKIEKEIQDLNCVDFINNKFAQMYEANFDRIFKIKTPLDKRYYKESENSRVDIFLAFDKSNLSGGYYFFGIDKHLSDFIFVNYFEELNMLTLDGHMRYNLDMSSLNDFGCIDLNPIDSVTNSFYENTTFENDSSKRYSIDSVLVKNDDSLLFNQGDSFHVENNSKFIFENDTAIFFFENYLIHIISDADTNQLKMVSQAESSKILLNPNTETLYFLTKH